jgi:hypothetical protein
MKRVGVGETIQLATRVPKALHRAAMLASIEEERPLQEWIAEALAEHLARVHGAGAPKRARPAAGMPREGA